MLACVGIYGVMAQTVTARARELAVRAAMGATKDALQGLVVRQTAIGRRGCSPALAGERCQQGRNENRKPISLAAVRVLDVSHTIAYAQSTNSAAGNECRHSVA